jgi:hypothetical protein
MTDRARGPEWRRRCTISGIAGAPLSRVYGGSECVNLAILSRFGPLGHRLDLAKKGRNVWHVLTGLAARGTTTLNANAPSSRKRPHSIRATQRNPRGISGEFQALLVQGMMVARVPTERSIPRIVPTAVLSPYDSSPRATRIHRMLGYSIIKRRNFHECNLTPHSRL